MVFGPFILLFVINTSLAPSTVLGLSIPAFASKSESSIAVTTFTLNSPFNAYNVLP